MLPIFINVLLVIHVLVSLLIILLVLMQRPKNEGLGAAFGGGMTENLFGAQTTNVLQTITRWLGGIFFGLTLMLSWLYVKQTTWRSSVQQRLSAPSAVPAAPATALPFTTGDVPPIAPSAGTEPVKPPPAKAEEEAATPPVPGAATTEKPAEPASPVPGGKPQEPPASAPADKSSAADSVPAPARDSGAAAPAPVPPAPAGEQKPSTPK
jgi:preprotein translocase subunit SecG